MRNFIPAALFLTSAAWFLFALRFFAHRVELFLLRYTFLSALSFSVCVVSFVCVTLCLRCAFLFASCFFVCVTLFFALCFFVCIMLFCISWDFLVCVVHFCLHCAFLFVIFYFLCEMLFSLRYAF